MSEPNYDPKKAKKVAEEIFTEDQTPVIQLETLLEQDVDTTRQILLGILFGDI